MRLEGATIFKGDRLWVSYAESSEDRGDIRIDPVQVEVMWSRKRAHDGVSLAGVRYLDHLKGTWACLLLREAGLALDNADFEKRKYIRMATALRAELRDPKNEMCWVEGRVTNLSVGGTLVQSNQTLPEGSRVQVMICPYTKFPIFSVPGQVLHTHYDANDGQHLLSLHFVQVNAKQIKTLKQFVFNLMKSRSLG